MPDTRAHWTVDALHELPEDGQRYDVVDGVLLVSPSPSAAHPRCWSWQRPDYIAPLTIDLVQFFRSVHGIETASRQPRASSFLC